MTSDIPQKIARINVFFKLPVGEFYYYSYTTHKVLSYAFQNFVFYYYDMFDLLNIKYENLKQLNIYQDKGFNNFLREEFNWFHVMKLKLPSNIYLLSLLKSYYICQYMANKLIENNIDGNKLNLSLINTVYNLVQLCQNVLLDSSNKSIFIDSGYTRTNTQLNKYCSELLIILNVIEI